MFPPFSHILSLVPPATSQAWRDEVEKALQDPPGWVLFALAVLVALLLALLIRFAYRFRSSHGSPEVAGSHLELAIPEEGGQLGNELPVQVRLRPTRTLHLDYLLVRLINKRLEKKAPLDKVVGHSSFLFRHNVDREVRSGELTEEPVCIQVPTCREPTRESKYVNITWEITLEAHFSTLPKSRHTRYVHRGTPELVQILPPSIP